MFCNSLDQWLLAIEAAISSNERARLGRNPE
jgi:hypothetical protein